MKTQHSKSFAIACAALLGALSLPSFAAQQPAFDVFSQGGRKLDTFSDGARISDGAAVANTSHVRDVYTDGARDAHGSARTQA